MKRFASRPQMKLAALVAALALSLLTLFGCGGGGSGTNNPPTPSRGVTIIVQDAFTGAPVSSASVHIGTKNFTTNSNGIVNAQLQTGAYQLQVSKNGYASFSTHIACFDGAQVPVKLTPNLLSPTDETFQKCSEQVLSAAKGLMDAITTFQNYSENSPQDATVLFESASNAFVAAMNNALNYTPRARGPQRGLLDIFQNLLSVTKVAQGTEQMQELKRRLLNGESVPEIDAWLASNPYQGARSVRELKEMYPGAVEVVLEHLFVHYQLHNPSSAFNSTAMEGAKDIFFGQFPDPLSPIKNLIGWGIDKVWNGIGKLVVTTVNYGQLVLENRKQIAWLWDKARGKLILTEIENETPMTVPQSTFDIIVTNGKAHKPTIVMDYQTGAGTQTLTITPTPISAPPPSNATVYAGNFVATKTQSNNLGTWQHSVNLTLQLIFPNDPNKLPILKVSGTYHVVRTAVAPGITLYEPAQGTYSFNAEGDYVSALSQIWDNGLAGGSVWISVQDMTPTGNAISVEVGSGWKFGSSGIVQIFGTVTLQRQ